MPEEFRPRVRRREKTSKSWQGVGPVSINYITLDSTGKIYILSAESDKIYVYGPDENFLFSFGIPGGSPGQLSQPMSLAIDEELGVIYVVDSIRHTVLIYDLTGEFFFEIGGRGQGEGWFQFPSAIAVNNHGQIIVADLFNKRVQVLKVARESILAYKNRSSPKQWLESFDAQESIKQNEFLPEQPQTVSGQENIPETTKTYPDGVIEEGIVSNIEIPSQLEISNDQENTQESLPEEFNSADYSESKLGQEREELVVKLEPFAKSSPIPPAMARPEEHPASSAEAGQQETSMVESKAKLPDFDAIELFVASWAEAWEEQNIESYLAHYSTNFRTPGGISLTEWERQRHKSVGRPKFVKVLIGNMQKQKLGGALVQVTFNQDYWSDIYSDKVTKTLELIWENGGWLIVKEESRER